MVSISRPARVFLVTVVCVAAVVVLYGTSKANYLLFHSLIELIAVVSLLAVFAVFLSARKAVGNGFIVTVGAASLSVAIAILLHLLAYKGMGVFPGDDANLATQLWLVSRYLLAGTLLVAALNLGREGPMWRALIISGVSLSLMFMSIFWWDMFPDAFIEGSGLTSFKVYSEYVVIVFLLVSMAIVFVRRALLETRKRWMVLAMLLSLVCAEMSFTIYVDVYGFFNFLGHVFQGAGFILLYAVIVDSAIARPLESVFRETAREREVLRMRVRDFEQLIEEVPVAYQSLDEAGRFVWVNSAWERMLGYSRSEVEGRRFDELLVEEEVPLHEARFEAFKRAGVAHGVVWHMRRKDSVEVTILFEGKVARDRTGGFLHTNCLLQSIAVHVDEESLGGQDREQLARAVMERTRELEQLTEQLTDAITVKDSFLANMSHELRTPLNSVIGFSGVLLQELPGPLNEEQHRQLEMIDRSGRHLLALVDDVLDVARLEGDTMKLDLESLYYPTILADVLEQVRPLAEEKGLELEWVPCFERCAKPMEVLVDERRMRQILFNLLGNAIKFTDKGKVTLALDCDLEDTVFIRVTDTGHGIRKDQMGRLFRDFVQLEQQEIGKPVGTGLGLSLSRRLARMMGGDILVDSTPGEGSTFTLILRK